MVADGGYAAPARPNNKKDDAHVLHELSLRNKIIVMVIVIVIVIVIVKLPICQ